MTEQESQAEPPLLPVQWLRTTSVQAVLPSPVGSVELMEAVNYLRALGVRSGGEGKVTISPGGSSLTVTTMVREKTFKDDPDPLRPRS